MSFGQSKLTIANIALTELGEDFITAFPSQAQPGQKTCANQIALRYEDCRLATLEARPWVCALNLAQLAASPTAPLFQYQNAYALPADCVSVVGLIDGDIYTDQAWDVRQRMLHTDIGGTINLVYVYDLHDVTLMSPTLVQTIGAAVAAAIAVKVTGSTTKRDKMIALYESRLEIAALRSDQQNSAKEWDVDVWLRSRT